LELVLKIKNPNSKNHMTKNENNPSSADGFSITATHILQHLFCPRFTYFEEVLGIPEFQEKRFKVQKGRQLHENFRKQNPDYLRKKIGTVRKMSDVYIAGMNIRGMVDEVLFLEDNTAAPLDYKYAEYKKKTFRNHKFQLAFYGLLIHEHFKIPVNRGFIVYVRSSNKLIEIPLTDKIYAELQDIINALADILTKGLYPSPTKYAARCPDCCYRNICEQII
jgi:CRISPR-associated exonuclease Cas4